MEQSCEDGIAEPDQRAYDSNGNTDDDRIGNELFLVAPGYLFHLSDHFGQKLLHNTFTSSLPDWSLLRFLMYRVLLAELAVLVELQAIRVVLLVLVGTVVAAMALRALQRDIVAHLSPPLTSRIMTLSPNVTHII